MRRLLAALLLVHFAATFAQAEPPSLAERARTHWAFQPVVRPALPAVADRAWPRTGVDAFLLARLEAAGLRPAASADRRTLLRRVTLVLTGLPPTLEEQAAFLADTSPDAWPRLIDRLLASPAYGERWGRHWLDVARYADTNGYERDGPKPHAWRYRDYVIAAWNADLPFDRFLREQIAGDELPGADAGTRIATTFLRLGTWDDEPANDGVDRHDQLDDVLGTTLAVFQGQTVRCARCHDHFFEPYSQRDYYRLLAVFEPLRRPQKGREDLDVPVGTDRELADHARFQAARDANQRAIDDLAARVRTRLLNDPTHTPADLRKIAASDVNSLKAAEKTRLKTHHAALNKIVATHLTADERPLWAKHHQEKETLARTAPPALQRAYTWSEDSPRPAPTRVLRRGNPDFPGAVVTPGIPAALGQPLTKTPQPLANSSGRRLWLADWLASRDNPLTARVLVNRLWQWHFGQGLVSTPSDFGLAGERPSHPELLDWLADELMRSGWSIKHVQRLILLSAAYQCDSRQDGPDATRKLPLYGRWRQRRLEAEAVRDATLAVSGQLNRRMSGPGVTPPLAAAVLASQSRPGLGWGKSSPEESARRSVYVHAKRSLALPELELLDVADSNASCEQRPVSTTAPQALVFLNGDFTRAQAAHFAERLQREADSPPAQVQRAFALAFARSPSAEELRLTLAFLSRQGDARRGLEALCLVLLNSNEFFYPG